MKNNKFMRIIEVLDKAVDNFDVNEVIEAIKERIDNLDTDKATTETTRDNLVAEIEKTKIKLSELEKQLEELDELEREQPIKGEFHSLEELFYNFPYDKTPGALIAGFASESDNRDVYIFDLNKQLDKCLEEDRNVLVSDHNWRHRINTIDISNNVFINAIHEYPWVAKLDNETKDVVGFFKADLFFVGCPSGNTGETIKYFRLNVKNTTDDPFDEILYTYEEIKNIENIPPSTSVVINAGVDNVMKSI